MQIVFYLSTCDTCKRILDVINIPSEFVRQDIKKQPITESQLEAMYRLTNSYEELFSKRAQLYRQRGLNQQELSETDYKNLLLEHYTFLRRPLVLDGDNIYIGSTLGNFKELAERFNS